MDGERFMDGVIDLHNEREKRDGPDAEHVMVADDGVKWFRFSASFEDDGAEFSFHFWAVDKEDAERRVALMRDGLRLDGQIYSIVDA